ncbi:MAG: M3 family oligoendopeptidase [Alphaproteobacteria bacterium]
MSNLPSWNLADFYPSFKSKLIIDDLNLLKKDTHSFQKKFKNKLKNLSKNQLLNSLKQYEKLEEKIYFIKSFSFLTHCTDQLNKEKNKFYQSTSETLSNIEKNLVFFCLELNNLGKEKIRQFDKTRYESWIKNLSKFKKYQQSENIEKLLMEKSLTSSSAWIKFFDQTMTRLKFKFRNKNLSETEILNLFSSPQQSIRKDAALSFGKTLKDNIFNFTFIMNNISKDLDIDKNLRGFDYSESSRHLSNQIEKKDVDSLVKTVKSNYSLICHRYYNYKAKYFGKKKLDFWDRNAPYPRAKIQNISWNEAQSIVFESYNSFDKRAGEVVKMFFDNSWIHASPMNGKTSGAFSHPTVPSCHPYILLNYQGRTRDVMTLAHELGHGIHQYLANKQGLLLADTPLTLAETASVFGEMLTFKSLIKNAKNQKEKIYLLRSKIEDMINTVFRQISFFIFERNIHTMRIKTELSEDDISDIWMETQKESLGPSVNLTRDYQYFWSYIPHFIHSPFYVYAYAFGDCLVNSLYSSYEKSSNGFNDKYLDMLKAGGSQDYHKLLNRFELNPKSSNFWQLGMNLIKNLIDDLEKIS